MQYERQIKITSEGRDEILTYFVTKRYSDEFECVMYNVGIKATGEEKEIIDFSPSIDEAMRFCNYICAEHVSLNNLFSAAEEFIVTK